MHFFRTREVAEHWAEGRSGHVVLTIEEGYELARAHWIERRRRAEARRGVHKGGSDGTEATG